MNKMDIGNYDMPSTGEQIYGLCYKNWKFFLRDSGVGTEKRQMWKDLMINANALILVVDATEKSKLYGARNDLHATLSDSAMQDAIVLVFANKLGRDNAMGTGEISDTLGLNALRTQYYIQASDAVRGDGLYQGIEWLEVVMRSRS